jgi:hypothetical protein
MVAFLHEKAMLADMYLPNIQHAPEWRPIWATWRLFSVPEHVALTAPALPEPTASTKQKHNHDDNQNQF